MRLYHSVFIILTFALAACAAPQATQAPLRITITADGESWNILAAPGSTVQRVLDQVGLSLNALDRTDPPAFTVLGDGATIRLIRVTEEFVVEQVTLPYQRQTLRNESLPVEKEVLIQRGKNGLQEVTYRRLFEDGVEVSAEPIPVNSVILSEPVPEIRMIGVQSPFTPINLPGRLYYLRDGNLWRIEGATNNRAAVIATGDLDGRVLSISDDGEWALFTRRFDGEGRINTLWAAYIGEGDQTGEPEQAGSGEPLLVDLGVDNVIHFADFAPGSNSKIYFSTVEPRLAPPGWQANNDLLSLNFSSNGWTSQWTTIIEPNAGGIYGWWGTEYHWNPDGSQLAFTRPDGIGTVDTKTGDTTKILDIIPLQTFGDWAWVPGLDWGPDGNSIYSQSHAAGEAAAAEDSPDFNLIALLPPGAPSALDLAVGTGMFAYPLVSPLQEVGSGEMDYQIAYLQAIHPETSQTSRYRVVVTDRDGSNRKTLFPPEESVGLEPQIGWGAWSPASLPGSSGLSMAALYAGNLWLVNVDSGEAAQVTGDGLTTRVLWK